MNSSWVYLGFFTILRYVCFGGRVNTVDLIQAYNRDRIPFGYHNRGLNYCRPYEFQCDSSQCIQEENECDGKADCQDGTDEMYNCEKLPCNTRYLFQCEYGACISKKLVCDGKNDCQDNSDETDLACNSLRPTITHPNRCRLKQFQCSNKGKCIPEEDQCDGKDDCDDGSDETQNCETVPCNSRYLFQCNYGACISKKQVCDRTSNCKDNSDETTSACRSLNSTLQLSDCRRFRFQCQTSKECIAEEDECDGKKDCPDGSDEAQNCRTIPCNSRYLFQCEYGACISRKLLCDGKGDCSDNSDEFPSVCPNVTNPACGTDEFRCRSGHCIDDFLVCDGADDCSDSSDETSRLCEDLHCPSYNFRCAYGACISLNSRCNGVKDCLDGSDEVSCGVTPPTSTTSNPSRTTCLIPSTLNHGTYALDNVLVTDQSHAPSLSHLITNCEEGYTNNPSDVFYSICRDCQWSPAPSRCSQKCPLLNLPETSKVTCEYEDQPLDSCENPFEGVSAQLPCVQGGIHRQNCTLLCKNAHWHILTTFDMPQTLVNNTLVNISLSVFPENGGEEKIYFPGTL